MENYIHKVHYYECDHMGITHHSNYIRIMEEARVDAMDKMGYGFERMEAEGVGSPVVSVNVSYRKTTTFQDEIEVELSVLDMSGLKIRFGYRMFVRGQLVCTAESVHCFIENGRPVLLEKRFPELFEAMKGYMRTEE